MRHGKYASEVCILPDPDIFALDIPARVGRPPVALLLDKLRRRLRDCTTGQVLVLLLRG